MKKLFFFIALGIAMNTFAQSNEHLSGFGMTSLTYKFSKHWFAYGELQARSYEEFSKPDYYEIKGGVGYNITPDHQPFIGMGRYATYKNNAISKEEFRIWLQYQYNNYIGKLKLEHRGRVEQQFFHFSQTGVNSTANRFRYRLNAILPINNDKIKPKTFFVNAFDEVFFGTDAPAYVRNRLYGGMGYQFDKSVDMATGYLLQREFSNTGNKNVHFWFVGLNFIIDRSANEKPKSIPTPVID